MSEILKNIIASKSIKVFILDKDDSNKEIARAYLYLIKNDLHDEPYGLIEDVFVDENSRRQGLGNEIVLALIQEAKDNNCYKLIAQSRHDNKKIHSWYNKLGFKEHGLNFRLNFEK